MIYGERLRQARELNGLTQKQLAENLEIAQSTVARIESGSLQPSTNLLDAIALRTGLPPAFFRERPLGGFPLGSLQYRARASLKSSEREQAHRRAELYREVGERMASRVNAIPVRVPFSASEPPAEAAELTRSSMGLSPDTPVPHLVSAVEQLGVLVLALPAVGESLDAFSCWPELGPRRPVIALAGQMPGDRLRLSVAHELGHLVMHHPPRGTIAGMEREAYQFAAELLMPERAMRQEIEPPVTLGLVAELKPRWRVSIQALVRRARDLGIVSERQYKYLFQQLTMRGWRKAEPSNLSIPREKPRALRKMAELLYGVPPDPKALATDMRLREQFVAEMIEAHASRSDLPIRARTPQNVTRLPTTADPTDTRE